jgi:hypothetical protein
MLEMGVPNASMALLDAIESCVLRPGGHLPGALIEMQQMTDCALPIFSPVRRIRRRIRYTYVSRCMVRTSFSLSRSPRRSPPLPVPLAA